MAKLKKIFSDDGETKKIYFLTMAKLIKIFSDEFETYTCDENGVVFV